jgi:hypothetical protein
MRYNPVVRNFCRVRRILVETLGLSRHDVRPTSTFNMLIPREQRGRVWEQFRREKIDVDSLGFSDDQFYVILFAMIVCLAVGHFLWRGSTILTILCPIVIGVIAANLLARWAVEIDRQYTVGEAVLATITAAQCRDAEYRLTRNEIFFKLRRVLAEAAGIDPNDITPEKSFRELGLE